jgi:hypothetical protein
MKLLITFIFIVIFANNVFGQPLITDRPDVADSPYAVGKNVFQIESGFLYEISQNSHTNVNTNFPGFLFRYGIIEPLELRLITGINSGYNDLGDSKERYNSFDNLNLGLKYELYQGFIDLGIMAYTVLPTASNSNDGEDNVGAMLLLSHNVTESISFSYNVGMELDGIYGDNGSDFTDGGRIILAYSIGYGITEKLSLFTELYGSYIDENDMMRYYFDSGMLYLINDDLQADMTFGFDLMDDETYNFFTIGLSYRIK